MTKEEITEVLESVKKDCRHDIVWQSPRPDDWYCKDFEKRSGGK